MLEVARPRCTDGNYRTNCVHHSRACGTLSVGGFALHPKQDHNEPMARWRTPAPLRFRSAGAIPGDSHISQLGVDRLSELLDLCAAHPVESVLVASQLDSPLTHSNWPGRARVWGFSDHGPDGPLAAACWDGANLMPIGADPWVAREFASRLASGPRRSSSIVGPSEPVIAMWKELSGKWSVPREIRARQLSMIADAIPEVAADHRVRATSMTDLDILLPACVAMFTEELGYSPADGGGLAAYTDRLVALIATGRSFAWIAESGPRGEREVIFKAEIGALANGVAQIQGVWIDPRFRGQGLAAPGMVAVVEAARATLAPTVSLYVNDFNTHAIAAYRRAGFREVGEFATILF